jgi:amino acid transporter
MFPRPQLLATIQFSIFFILFCTTAVNAVVFTKYVLALAMPNTSVYDMDDRLINLVAVFVQTSVCLLLYFGRRLTLFLNKTFAFFKISLMTAIFVGGMTAKNRRQGSDDFKQVQPGYNGADCLAAMVYILFSYQGWENANYVGREPHIVAFIDSLLGCG